MAILIVFLIISSGSLFSSSYFGKRYEEALPVTVLAISAFLYVLGLAGILSVGVYVIYAAAIAAFALAFVNAAKKKSLKTLVKNTFTPAFFIWIISFILILYLVYGMDAHFWDEYSRWLDFPRRLAYADAFPTAQTQIPYSSYPPGLAMLEYLFQKTECLITGSAVAADWYVYMGLNTLVLSLFMPFLKKLDFSSKPKIIAYGAALFLVQYIIYPAGAYSQCTSELPLAIFFGCGIAYVFAEKDYSAFGLVRFSLLVFMLTLLKDVALLPAVILVLMYAVDVFAHRREITGKKVLHYAVPALSLIAAKVSWAVYLSVNSIAQSTSSADIPYIIKAIFGGLSEYEQSIYYSFINKLGSGIFSLGALNIDYGMFIALLAVLIFVLVRMIKDKKKKRLLTATFIVSTVAYTVGLLFLYMFVISEGEAIGLVSMERYLYFIPGSFIAALFCMYTEKSLEEPIRLKGLGIGVIVFVMLATPYLSVYNTFSKFNVVYSENQNKKYNAITEQFKENAEENSHVYLVLQSFDTSFDAYAYRMKFGPQHSVNRSAYSIVCSEENNVDDSSEIITAEEWMDNLIRDGYAYVVLINTDEGFFNSYAELFDFDPRLSDDIQVYRVDAENRKLLFDFEIYLEE